MKRGIRIIEFTSAVAIITAFTIPAVADVEIGGVKINLQCDQMVSAFHWPSNSQTATATITVPDGYTMTGGGCERPKNFEAVDMYSKPTEDGKGWTCQTFDYPGLRIDASIRAWVRYCRISSSNE